MIAGINESFESAQTSTQMDTDNNNDDLLSCVDDDDLSVWYNPSVSVSHYDIILV